MTVDPRTLLPLHPMSFEILLVLLDGPSHAYSIVKQIEEESDGAERLMPANLYRRIRDMLEQELIDERPATGDARRWRELRITPLGRRTAIAEAKRLEAAVLHARRKGLLRNA